MKKLLSYFLLITMIVVVLPLFIVKGCNFRKDNDWTTQGENTKIKVYMTSENKIVEVPLEEYIKCVVAAEMPASFEIEALKAQAVAARTYAFSRMVKLYLPKDEKHPGADTCTDPAHCQAWVSKETAMKRWGFFSAYKNWKKIDKAVQETSGLIAVYNGSPINAVFHSNSGGRTESAKDWTGGGDVPYLRSVVSEGEDATSEFKNTVAIPVKEFIEKLKSEYPNFKANEKDILKEVKILDYTDGRRVKNIKIGNITLKGTEVRKVFSLKSTNFIIEKGENGSLNITTLGYGHGVGMSQWGADYLAKGGGNYEEILKYYYQGIELESIESYLKRTKQ